MCAGDDIETFLWFLDDGSLEHEGEWFGLPDFLEAVSSPKKLRRCLGTRAQFGHPESRAVRGLFGFLRYCAAFESLLLSMRNPVVKSLFWHTQAYWFSQLGGRLGGVIDVALERFAEAAGGKDGEALDPEDRRRLGRSQEAMRRLTSGVFRAPVDLVIYQGEDRPEIAKLVSKGITQLAPFFEGEAAERAES
jgi:hypothetical protein